MNIWQKAQTLYIQLYKPYTHYDFQFPAFIVAR